MRTTTTEKPDCYATAPKNPRGRPAVLELACGMCKLRISERMPVLFAEQARGSGPYVGMSGWYTAIVHADPCGAGFLRDPDNDYAKRACRGCGRGMWLRAGSCRAHCSSPCRQADYRRRREADTAALREGRVLYRDELYWLTKPEAAS